MKRFCCGKLGTLLVVVVWGLSLVACEKNLVAYEKDKDNQENKDNAITMKTKQKSVMIILAGTGTASIDWGDGASETQTLSENLSEENQQLTEHDYSDTAEHTIRITGNVTLLYCADNALTSLDVSQNAALKMLACSNNQLTSLDLRQNTALEKLACSSNVLTSLDVSQNTALERLACSSNALTSLNAGQSAALTHLYLDHNQLTSLDVKQYTALELLHCDYNQLENLDLSKNIRLSHVYLTNNGFNGLTDTALNDLFDTLIPCDSPGSKFLYIAGNPGTSGPNFDESIAIDKGWGVDTNTWSD